MVCMYVMAVETLFAFGAHQYHGVQALVISLELETLTSQHFLLIVLPSIILLTLNILTVSKGDFELAQRAPQLLIIVRDTSEANSEVTSA